MRGERERGGGRNSPAAAAERVCRLNARKRLYVYLCNDHTWVRSGDCRLIVCCGCCDNCLRRSPMNAAVLPRDLHRVQVRAEPIQLRHPPTGVGTGAAVLCTYGHVARGLSLLLLFSGSGSENDALALRVPCQRTLNPFAPVGLRRMPAGFTTD
jgi:hypothetical protein